MTTYVEHTCKNGALFPMTEEEWDDLPRVGLQDDGAGGFLDQRQCSVCATTISVELPEQKADAVRAALKELHSPGPSANPKLALVIKKLDAIPEERFDMAWWWHTRPQT